ncbi:hypothetical protein [Marinobacter salexigens]|uniref:hypothetical protein n=1 Tax=Marinobacter salexigens TaxID=1925763 RepID=UPI000C2890B0|nr:hypothetical protein [Marinobacter salexigens]
MVNLLWTGGWDSTFRLLQLAQEGAVIQPHYIRDPHRDSLKKEIQAMNEIRHRVNERFPDCFIRDTKIIDQSDIIVCQYLFNAHKNLLSRGWIGSQYIYTSSYILQNEIKTMELSIELLSDIRHSVMPCLKNTEINKEGNRVISKNADKDLFCLFRQCSFPVLALTKLDMYEIAKECGILDILNLTWFCHQPLFRMPCGSCNPCMSTLEDGLKYRFGIIALARYRMKKLLISQPKIHKTLRKMKYGSSDYS